MDTALVLAGGRLVDDPCGAESLSDILVENGRIAAVAPAGTIQAPAADRIDLRGGIVIPGLCNAHAHSHELFMKGTVWGIPLEPYIARISVDFPVDQLPEPEDIYTRTLAACAEMLMGGITGVADDVIHPKVSAEFIEAVLTAYEDSGLRANVSVMLEDRPWADSIPHADELVPPHLRERVDRVASQPDVDAPVVEGLIRRWRQRSTRVRVMMSPSAPQRCTESYLRRQHAIARDNNVPFHIHIQETLAQAVSGPRMYGSSMIQYCDRLGILDEFTTIAHAVWLSDDDLHVIANSGASVAHNPISNMKLGSGIARVRELLDANVNVALGCDGYTCNDSQDMFEAMKAACLVSAIATPVPAKWLGPRDALQMATGNGARANRWPHIGSLEPGAVADLVILDAAAPAFQPLNDLPGQVVFCARRSEVVTVLVEGRVVVANGVPTLFDVESVHRKLEGAAERFAVLSRPSRVANQALIPYLQAGYEQELSHVSSLGVYRLVADGNPRDRV